MGYNFIIIFTLLDLSGSVFMVPNNDKDEDDDDDDDDIPVHACLSYMNKR